MEAAAVGSFARQFPAQLTSFVGRERELAAVCGLLTDPSVRLLTLSGPGGAGKTRLAAEAAADLERDFSDGVVLVDLAPLADPDLVLPTIARALDLADAENRPLLERLGEYLRPRPVLLVVDNFEHLIPAAPLLSNLLAAAPGLKLLVTSRALLRLSGEHELAVPPLELPPAETDHPEALTRSAAVRLFLDRAQAAGPWLDPSVDPLYTVAALCRRLDGLPLAIELAAARTRLLTPR